MATGGDAAMAVKSDESLGALCEIHVAHVRYIDGDDHLRLQLRIRNDRKTFFRPVTEKCDKLRYRLQILAAAAAAAASDGTDPNGGFAGCRKNALGHVKSKKARGKTKKKKSTKPRGTSENDNVNTPGNPVETRHEPAQTKVSVRFFNDDGLEFLSKNLAIGDVLMQTARIEIGDISYIVLKNQPLVLKLSVLEPVLAGIPMIPIPETEFCEPDECSWKWFLVGDDGQGVLCSTTRRYVPSNDETGSRFRVECHAPSMHSLFADDSKVEIVTTPVIRGPSREVFKKRQLLGKTRACDADNSGSSAFRVMSYNILFDGYTTTGHAQENLFPYVSASVMNEMYRMQLVFQEIEESNADIICLQEMGETTYNTFFAPMMKPVGFHTFYLGKTGSTHEGCAVFIRSNAFEVVSEHMVDLGMTIKHSPDPTIKALLTEFPEIAKGFDKIPSVAQIFLLRSTRAPTKHLVLSNTHLFYREDAHLIRLLQTVAVVREVSKIRLDVGNHVGLLLCGDYNSFPHTAPVHFLLNANIDSSHREWQDAPQFKWNRTVSKTGNKNSKDHPSNHRVEHGRFEHHLALESACGIPAFTNFAGTFVGTLDYIMMGSECLAVKQVFPFFTTEEISEEVALPSSKFPSDHISLICDLDWKASCGGSCRRISCVTSSSNGILCSTLVQSYIQKKLNLPSNLSVQHFRGTFGAFQDSHASHDCTPEDAVIVGFNTGFGNFVDSQYYGLLFGWLPDLYKIADSNIPAIFTCANDYADMNGEFAVQSRVIGAKMLLLPQQNPFSCASHLHEEGQRETAWSRGNSFLYATQGYDSSRRLQLAPGDVTSLLKRLDAELDLHLQDSLGRHFFRGMVLSKEQASRCNALTGGSTKAAPVVKSTNATSDSASPSTLEKPQLKLIQGASSKEVVALVYVPKMLQPSERVAVDLSDSTLSVFVPGKYFLREKLPFTVAERGSTADIRAELTLPVLRVTFMRN